MSDQIFVSNLSEVWVVGSRGGGRGLLDPYSGVEDVTLNSELGASAEDLFCLFFFAVVAGIFQLLPRREVGVHAPPPPEINHFVHLVPKINVLNSHGPCFPKLPFLPCSHHFRHLFPCCVPEIIATDVMLGVNHHVIFKGVSVCVCGGGLFIF